MINKLRNVKLLKRLFSTTSKVRGGHHNHHPEPANSNSLWHKIKSQIMIPPHPKEHQGYLYRELGNLQGANNATMAKIALSLAWYWIFYNLWAHPENIYGHAPYPDTSKWTDEELGIPADDEE